MEWKIANSAKTNIEVSLKTLRIYPKISLKYIKSQDMNFHFFDFNYKKTNDTSIYYYWISSFSNMKGGGGGGGGGGGEGVILTHPE